MKALLLPRRFVFCEAGFYDIYVAFVMKFVLIFACFEV